MTEKYYTYFSYGIYCCPAGCGFDSRWCHWNFSV